jgi:hypothetical protein
VPSIPATSAFLPATLLLGADSDAPGALAVVLPLAPADECSEGVVVVPDTAVAVVVVDDADVPVGVLLPEDPVGRVKPVLPLVALVAPARVPVGEGVASAAVSAQYAFGHSVQSCGTLTWHAWCSGQTGHVGITSVHITQLFCRGSWTARGGGVVAECQFWAPG